jgi:predicted dehydrogenase
MSLDIFETWAANLDKIDGSVILGSKAGVRLSPFGFFKNVGNLDMVSTADMGSAEFRWSNVGEGGSYYGDSQAHWIAALQGKVPLLPTAEIALNTMLISEGIYMSESVNREVTAEEVLEASKSTAVPI